MLHNNFLIGTKSINLRIVQSGRIDSSDNCNAICGTSISSDSGYHRLIIERKGHTGNLVLVQKKANRVDF